MPIGYSHYHATASKICVGGRNALWSGPAGVNAIGRRLQGALCSPCRVCGDGALG